MNSKRKRDWIIATIIIITICACRSISTMSSCEDKPEDVFDTVQLKSFYRIIDSLITGTNLRGCQLSVVAEYDDKAESAEYTMYKVYPKASYFRTMKHYVKASKQSVYLAK